MRIIMAALVACLGQGAWAAVTYEGTDGVRANVFEGTTYSSLSCDGCHNSTYGQTPYLTTWSEVSSYGSSTTADYSCYDGSGGSVGGYAYMNHRVQCGEMPSGDDLSATGKSLFSNWASDGYLRWDQPDVSTWSATGVGRYSGTLRASVNENGAGSSFWFRYATNSSLSGYTQTSFQYPSGTGGGLSNTTLSQSLSGLSCGTTYYYRGYGNNSQGTTTGTLRNFTTSACPQIDAIGTQSATEETLFSYNVNANLGGLTYSLDTAPSGMSINSSTGVISWTPDDPVSTPVSVWVRATDGTTDDTEFFQINVTATNDAPVIGTAAVTSATEESAYSYNVDASDAESNTIYYCLASSPSGMSINSSTGVISWTPDEPYSSPSYVSVRASDANSSCSSSYDTQSFWVSITPVNDVPVISSVADTTATEEQAYSYDVNAGDDDGDTITYCLATAPSGMSINSSTGVISWTPDEPYSSPASVSVRASDAGAGCASSYDLQSYSLTVTAVNDGPVITSSPSTSATEGVQYQYQVQVNDPDDSNNGTDISFTLTQKPSAMTVSSTGLITWTPPNGTTSADVTVEVADGGEDGAAPATQSWTISADAVNDPPVITSTAGVSATEDQQYQYQVQVSDPDDSNNGADLAFSLTNAPSGMSVSNTGLITWTPLEGVTTSGSVTVTVADGGENGVSPDTESVTVSVTPVNDQPVIISTAGTSATEDQQYQYQVQVNDPDDGNNGTDLVFSLTNAPSGMSVSTTGLITWTPLEGVSTSGTVTLGVSDGGEDGTVTATEDFTVSVTAVNDPVSIQSSAGTAATEDQQYQYQVQVRDPDDSNNGTDISFILVNAPTGMTVSATGLIQWTPANGVTSGSVDLRVADGLEDGAASATQSWTINVTAVNDAPVIQQAANDSVEELSAFSLPLTELDVDDDNNGSDLSWSAVTLPTGMTLSSTGLLEWTPGQGTAGAGASQDYTVAVQLADGGEDGSTPDQMSFTLTVTKLDTDADTVADYNDNCPDDANTDQANNDGDGQGDVCDADDDNDGIDDTAELANGLDPFEDTDASGDLDGDGLTNLEEFQTCAAGSDSTCNAIGTDSVAPVISVSDLTVPSTGYFTEVALEATAEDGIDGVVDVTPGDQGPFRPGRHNITWTAQDSEGNTATAVQTLDVLPQVSLGGSTTAGEGVGVSVPVRLNGPAPAYPVSMQLSLSGTADAADHDLAAPVTVTFNSGTGATVAFNTLADGLAEGDERLRLTLDGISGNAVAGAADSHDLLIVERQVAPETAMTVTQNSIQSLEVYQGQGVATVSANATDANGDAPLVYDWASTLTLNLAGDSVSFDPDAVSPGTYTVSLSVSDAVATVRDQVAIRVHAAAEFPASGTTTDSDGDGLDDGTEGPGDSDGDGIPDYRDGIDSVASQVVEQDDAADPASALLMKVEDGLSLRVGARAMSAGNDRASLSSTQVGVEDPLYTHLGLIYDFEVHGLTEAKRTARVVVPLRYALVPGAVWRKFANGSWYSFISNGSEMLHSSPTVEGVCPDPLAAGWQSGLNPGHACVRLTLVDGGANDADGVVNGVIRDPGGAAVRTETPESESAPDSAANSGELGVRVLLVLAVLGLFRRRLKSY